MPIEVCLTALNSTIGLFEGKYGVHDLTLFRKLDLASGRPPLNPISPGGWGVESTQRFLKQQLLKKTSP